MKKSVTFLILLFSFGFSIPSNEWEWVIRTDPYKSFMYPGETGLNYFLKYNYGRESKSIRKFLNREYDVKNSPGIKSIYKEVSSGAFFDRKIYFTLDFLRKTDTVIMKIVYENGDSLSQKFFDLDERTFLEADLTRYKNQHDFSTGETKLNKQKGLVTRVDLFVRPRGTSYDKNSVRVISKLITTANMPGLVNRVNGAKILKRK